VSLLVVAFLVGVVAGLRSMTAPAVVSWAARLGWLHLEGTPFAFLGHAATPWILSLLALVELVTDQLPKTPSRKAPPGFIARLVTGGFCGAALGAPAGLLAGGLVAGVVGAVAGTFGGFEFRARLARAFGKDLPAALIEDLVAVGGGLLLVARLG